MADLRRQNTPPKPGPACEILRLNGPERRTFYVLSESVWGVWTHWDSRSKRSVPCTGESAADCEGHKNQMPSRWKGYLCVLDVFRGRVAFLELTPGGAAQLALQTKTNESLRGSVLIGSRTSAGKGSRVRFEVQSYVRDDEILPPARDPEEYLRALWKM